MDKRVAYSNTTATADVTCPLIELLPSMQGDPLWRYDSTNLMISLN